MERSLETHYRVLAAAFADAPAGSTWKAQLGADFREALELLVFVLAKDLANPPREIDGEGLAALLGSLLPGRLQGNERYRAEIVDLLEEFLLFIVREEGLTTGWEWTTAIDRNRPSFETALKNPSRPVPGTPVIRAPDRRAAPKIGRNDPCFCGSGRKYKHCCGKPA